VNHAKKILVYDESNSAISDFEKRDETKTFFHFEMFLLFSLSSFRLPYFILKIKIFD